MSVVRNAARGPHRCFSRCRSLLRRPQRPPTPPKTRPPEANMVPEKGEPQRSADRPPSASRARQVCYRLTDKGIEPPNAALLPSGAQGDAGPLIVTLLMGEADRSGCVKDNAKVAAPVTADLGARCPSVARRAARVRFSKLDGAGVEV